MRSPQSRGTQTRYDNDYYGNHIQRERDKNAVPRLCLTPQNTRRCTRCKTRKPAKGGTGIGVRDGFICADCRKPPNTGINGGT